jgi:hypothetical protein
MAPGRRTFGRNGARTIHLGRSDRRMPTIPRSAHRARVAGCRSRRATTRRWWDLAPVRTPNLRNVLAKVDSTTRSLSRCIWRVEQASNRERARRPRPRHTPLGLGRLPDLWLGRRAQTVARRSQRGRCAARGPGGGRGGSRMSERAVLEAVEGALAELQALRTHCERRGWSSTETAQRVTSVIAILESVLRLRGPKT